MPFKNNGSLLKQLLYLQFNFGLNLISECTPIETTAFLNAGLLTYGY
jgi:hypothetical protein